MVELVSKSASAGSKAVVTCWILTEVMVGNLPVCKAASDFPNPRRQANKTTTESPSVKNFDPCQRMFLSSKWCEPSALAHMSKQTTDRVQKTLFHQWWYFMPGVVNLMIIPAAYTMSPKIRVNSVIMAIGPE